MDSKYQYRFLLLDFGHPMNTGTIKKIINSLENVLLLNLALLQNVKQTTFKVLVLNSDFVIIHFESNFQKNYNLVANSLNQFLKKTSERFTVQEFKSLLSNSIEKILCEIERKFKEGKILNEQLIQIAVVSKKSAWVLADILASVTSKLQRLSVENFKIVHILNETQQKTDEENLLIDCIFCLDCSHDLDGFFKEWLLNPQQELRIVVSKDANLEIKCEIEDCVIKPVTFSSKFDVYGDVQFKEKNILVDQVCKLEIINKIPVSGVCPTLVFGTPRRIQATCWSGSQTNASIFKQLCRELNRNGEGLLAKSALPNGLVTFHFLTSDGHMILMNDVAPDELHLPKRKEFSKSAEFSEDEGDAFTVRDCLQKIKLLHEFTPKDFSSGLYKFIKHYFEQIEQSKHLSADCDSYVFEENPPKKENNETVLHRKTYKGEKPKNNGRKKSKLDSEKEVKNVHPALLSPETVKKYRKVDKRAFNLPELGKEFM